MDDNIYKNKFGKRVIFNKIILFVPYCDIYKNYIIKCLNSIENQNYKYYEVIIVVDGYVLDYNLLLDFVKEKANYKLLVYKNNNGPAFSKWKFIEYIQTNINNYKYNDIIGILDGDDYLENDAFHIINHTYNHHNCWVTFGNAIGKFCNFKVDYDILKSYKNIRKEKWLYNHIRTCKLGLLLNFKEDDFKMHDKWLIKCTDRPFVYNIIEWSGFKKTRFINSIIYNYIEHDNNSYKTIDNNTKQRHLTYVTNIEPKQMIIEDIHIVMCVYKRVFNLKIQLENLNEQTVSNRIILHIVNNNPDNNTIICDLLLKYSNKIKYYIYNYDNTYFGFQRFLTIKNIIIKNFIIDYIIIIDDDQIFSTDWVEKLYELREPQVYYSWYVKKWDPNNLDYWNGSIINITDCRRNNNPHINERLHYGATCGCIIDIKIFNDNSELWRLPTNLPENVTIYNIEDLWLSYIIICYGWNIKRSFLPEQISLNLNSESEKESLWCRLINEKQLLLEFLVNK
uniref:Glycosyltransferase 2-like domain-containing protein n=1 Tax=viral metagenome TaxID=1070528 RepID=A0A6C0ESP2_9ZZZZ